jgi:hypothetical protein
MSWQICAILTGVAPVVAWDRQRTSAAGGSFLAPHQGLTLHMQRQLLTSSLLGIAAPAPGGPPPRLRASGGTRAACANVRGAGGGACGECGG